MNSELEVYVLNSHIGESIILKFNELRFAVIDLYESKTGDIYSEKIIPPEAEIEFVALTHPHFDHFKGLPDFLERNISRIGSFWRYPGLSSRELLARYLTRAYKGHSSKNDDYKLCAKGEFERLIMKLGEIGTRWGNQYKRISDPELHRVYSHDNIEVYAIAPLEPVVKDFEDFVDDPKAPIQEQQQKGENLVSCFYTVKVKDWYLLFLSDIVDERIWRNVKKCLSNANIEPSKIIYAKCSHHGSMSGYNQSFFKWCKPLEHMTITSFSRSYLPERKWVNFYRGLANTVTTVSGEYKKPNDLAKSYEQLVDKGANCDHVSIDESGTVQSNHMDLKEIKQPGES